MEEIILKARELAQMVKESEQFKRAVETEQIQKNDEKAQNMIKEYNDKRRDAAMKMQNQEISNEDSENIIKEINEAFDKLMEYDVIKNYVEAQKDYEELNQKVIAIVTGNEGGCGGSCSSCSGCH